MCKFSIVLAATLCALAAGSAHANVNCAPIVVPTTGTLLQSDSGLWKYGLFGDGSTDLGFGGPQPDLFPIELYSDGSAGTFDLGAGIDSNYSTCSHCVLIYRDIQGDVPGKVFYQSAGTLTLNQPAGAATLDFSVSGLHLVEVTLDPNTFASTPVPDGECYIQAADKIFVSGFDPA